MINYIKSKSIFFVTMNLILILIYLYFWIIHINLSYFITIFVTANLVLILYITFNGYLIIKHTQAIDYLLDNITEIHLVSAHIKSNDFYEYKLLKEYLELYSKRFYNLYHQEITSNKDYENYIILLVHDIKLHIQNIKLINTNYDTLPLELLCQRILITSKINHFNFDNNLTQVTLSPIISNILLDYFDICYNKIVVEVNLSTKVHICDEYWITFILRQLIDNAVKYTNNKIIINVDNNSISIISNGTLLTDHDITHITNRGYIGTNSNFKSSGYGLYLVAVICKNFNYKLLITNNLINEFKIILKE